MITKRYLLDVLERTLATYAQVFLGLLLAADALNIDAVEVALVSAIPAALAVVKASIASQFGDKGSASLVPATKAGE